MQEPELREGFFTASLFTAAGALVHTTEIPAFRTLPDVLVWGDRVFLGKVSAPGLYYECFALVVH